MVRLKVKNKASSITCTMRTENMNKNSFNLFKILFIKKLWVFFLTMATAVNYWLMIRG